MASRCPFAWTSPCSRARGESIEEDADIIDKFGRFPSTAWSSPGSRGRSPSSPAAGRRTWTSRADARRPGEISDFVEGAAAELGGIDLLVNNVGVFRKAALAE